jgi:mono/diheme cytochrome c family protein
MRKAAPSVFVLLIVVSLTALTAAQQPRSPYPPPRPMTLASPATSAARGAQLVMLGGCHDCHTPKLPNGQINLARTLSGQPLNGPLPPEVAGGVSANMHLTAWRGPWGVTLARNITPDKATGIGTWTLTDFKKTIRTGIDPKGVVLQPPMPIPTLQNLPDEDLEAIFNYLRTLKPIVNDTSGRTAPVGKKGPQ